MIWGDKAPKCPTWRRACIQYLNCSGDTEGSVPSSRLSVLQSRFSIYPSRFSDSHTKSKTPGHLDEKVAGNGNYYKTPAKVSTNLRRRPFFDLHLSLVAISRNSGLISAKTCFFLVLHPDCCRTPIASRLDCESVHPCNILQFKCCLYPTPSKKQLSASCLFVNHFLVLLFFAYCVHCKASFCRPLAACRPWRRARIAKWLLRHWVSSSLTFIFSAHPGFC